MSFTPGESVTVRFNASTHRAKILRVHRRKVDVEYYPRGSFENNVALDRITHVHRNGLLHGLSINVDFNGISRPAVITKCHDDGSMDVEYEGAGTRTYKEHNVDTSRIHVHM